MKPLVVVCALLASVLAVGRPVRAASQDQGAEILADFEPTAAQVDRETQGTVTVRIHGSQEALKTVQAQTVVDAPARIVWNVLTDYADYPNLFPRIAKSEIHVVDGVQEHYTVLRYPWPYSERWVTNAIQTDPRHWTIQWHRLKGSVRELVGEWQLRPRGDQTVLRYGVRVDPGLPYIPMWAVQWGTQIMTPSILRAVAKEAEREAQVETATKPLVPGLLGQPAKGSPITPAGYPR